MTFPEPKSVLAKRKAVAEQNEALNQKRARFIGELESFASMANEALLAERKSAIFLTDLAAEAQPVYQQLIELRAQVVELERRIFSFHQKERTEKASMARRAGELRKKRATLRAAAVALNADGTEVDSTYLLAIFGKRAQTSVPQATSYTHISPERNIAASTTCLDDERLVAGDFARVLEKQTEAVEELRRSQDAARRRAAELAAAWTDPGALLHDIFTPDPVGVALLKRLMPREVLDDSAFVVVPQRSPFDICLYLVRLVPLADRRRALHFIVHDAEAANPRIGASLYALMRNYDSATGEAVLYAWFDHAVACPRQVPVGAFEVRVRAVNKGVTATCRYYSLDDILARDDVLSCAEVTVAATLRHQTAGKPGLPFVYQPAWESTAWRTKMQLEYDGFATHRFCHISGIATNVRCLFDEGTGIVRKCECFVVEDMTGQVFWLPFTTATFRKAIETNFSNDRDITSCACTSSFGRRLRESLMFKGEREGVRDQLLREFLRTSKATAAVAVTPASLSMGALLPSFEDVMRNDEADTSAMLAWSTLAHTLHNRSDLAGRLEPYSWYLERAPVELPTSTESVPYAGVSVIQRYAQTHDDIPFPSGQMFDPEEDRGNYKYVPLGADGKPFEGCDERAKRSCDKCGIVGSNRQTHFSPNHGRSAVLTGSDLRRWMNSLSMESDPEKGLSRFVACLRTDL